MSRWGGFVFAFLLIMIPGISRAEESSAAGMITIEIVEDPTFFELYGNYIYMGVIILFLALFFWRRYQQGRSRS
ncbi:hypothetical protein JW933_01655 [candidate division FCPU426 bacterium]|nr:hypothetical protein [candidate division FCPU426 bacterium]